MARVSRQWHPRSGICCGQSHSAPPSTPRTADPSLFSRLLEVTGPLKTLSRRCSAPAPPPTFATEHYARPLCASRGSGARGNRCASQVSASCGCLAQGCRRGAGLVATASSRPPMTPMPLASRSACHNAPIEAAGSPAPRRRVGSPPSPPPPLLPPPRLPACPNLPPCDLRCPPAGAPSLTTSAPRSAWTRTAGAPVSARGREQDVPPMCDVPLGAPAAACRTSLATDIVCWRALAGTQTTPSAAFRYATYPPAHFAPTRPPPDAVCVADGDEGTLYPNACAWKNCVTWQVRLRLGYGLLL